MLKINITRTEQPKEIVPLDTKHWAYDNMVHCFNFVEGGNKIINLVTGKIYTVESFDGVNRKRINYKGHEGIYNTQSYGNTIGVNDGGDGTDYDINSSRDYSFLGVGMKVNQLTDFMFHMGVEDGGGSGDLRLNVNNGGTWRHHTAGSNFDSIRNVQSGVVHGVGATGKWNGSDLLKTNFVTRYTDDYNNLSPAEVAVNSTTHSNLTLNTHQVNLSILKNAGGSNYAYGALFLNIWWIDRALTNDEMRKLLQNPWQIFEPITFDLSTLIITSVSTDDNIETTETPWEILGSNFGAR